MAKINKNLEPQLLEEGEVKLKESADELTNRELLKVSIHVRVRIGANGAAQEIDALLFEQGSAKTAVKIHEAGSKHFPQWSSKKRGIWTSPEAHRIAQANKRWARTSEPTAEEPRAGTPIDPHAQAPRWEEVEEALQKGKTLE